MRHFLATAALIATGLLPGQDFVQVHGAGDTSGSTAIERPLPAQAMPGRNTVAIALRTALRNGFVGQDVRIRLARIDIAPAGPAQGEVRATGRVLLDGEGDWIDFETVALYDMESGKATTTSLQLETPRELAIPVDAALAAKLKAEATRRLRAEFASQP